MPTSKDIRLKKLDYADENHDNASISDSNLEDCMIQNGKYTSLSTSHETANSAKQKLAPNSFSEYLNTLAASRKTSLASCSAMIIEPIRKNLQKFPVHKHH